MIWTKQAAFAVAGLARQYRYGMQQGFTRPVLLTILEAIIQTAEACVKGWKDLDGCPELYYYDSQLVKARFFTDQDSFIGQMSLIQLWSAVGCRRIIREYLWALDEKASILSKVMSLPHT